MNLEQHHHDLDCANVGAMAIRQKSQQIYSMDGSIVVCESTKAMLDWARTYLKEEPREIAPLHYGDLVSSISDEGISYHLDPGSADHFFSLLSIDWRFRPEVLHFQDEAGTLFTSSFDPNIDPLSELEREINAFVVGYLDPGAQSQQYIVRGRQPDKASESTSSPLRFIEYHALKIAQERLDPYALWRLESMSPWIAMLDESDG